MDNSTSPFSIPAQPITPSSRKKDNRVAIAVVVIFVLLGAYFGYKHFKKAAAPKPPVVVTAEPTLTETPAPVDKTTVKIQVQNGTGTPGQAGSAVKALVSAGFVTGNIKTGNADNYADTSGSISVKSGFEGTANDVKNALTSLFPDITVNSTSLDSTSAYDVVVVTGGKLYVAPTAAIVNPTQTPIPVDTTTITPTVTPTPTDTPTPTPTP